MDEVLLVKHLIELYKIAQECGILQLEDYSDSSNEWYKKPLYAYCIRAILNGVDFTELSKYLELCRTREDLIIIKGFEFINKHNYSIKEVSERLGAMLEFPQFHYELMQ
jgi:hypothetical protein